MMLNQTNYRWVLQTALVLCLFANNAYGASSSSSSTSSSVVVHEDDKKMQDLAIQDITGLIPDLISIVREYTGGYKIIFPAGLQRSSTLIPKFGPNDRLQDIFNYSNSLLSAHWRSSFNLGNGLILFASSTQAIVLAPSARDNSPIDTRVLTSSKILDLYGSSTYINGCAPLPGHANTYVLYLQNFAQHLSTYLLVFSTAPKPNANHNSVILDVNVKAIFLLTKASGSQQLRCGGCKIFETGPYAGYIAVPIGHSVEIYNLDHALKTLPNASQAGQPPIILPLRPLHTIHWPNKEWIHLIPLKEDNRFLIEAEGLFEIYDSTNYFRERTHAFGTKNLPQERYTIQGISPLTTDHEGNILFVNTNNELIKYDANNGMRLMQEKLFDIQIRANDSISQILMLQDGNCCLVSPHQLTLYDLTNQNIVETAPFPEKAFGSSYAFPYHTTTQLADGRIAVSANQDGVYLFERAPSNNLTSLPTQPHQLQLLHAHLLQIGLRQRNR